MRKLSGCRVIFTSRLLVLFSAVLLHYQSQAQQAPTPGSNTAAAFLASVALKYPVLVAAPSLTINAQAKWTVGSQKESGTAVLKADGSGASSVQLSLNQATRTESRNLLGSSRQCLWEDNQGSHQLNDVDCNASVPWFAPMLTVQPLAAVLQLLSITDDGAILRNSLLLRQISYVTPMLGNSDKVTNFLSAGTRMSVLYDPQTLLPNSLEYLQHADTDLNTTFPVRIVYSNYVTSPAGIPFPNQIDQYVNGNLQLSLTVTSVSLQ